MCRSRRDMGGDVFWNILSRDEATSFRLNSASATSWSVLADAVQAHDATLTEGPCLNYINATCVYPGSISFDLRRPFSAPSWVRNGVLSERRQRFFALRCPEKDSASWWEQEGSDRNLNDLGVEKYRHRTADGGCLSAKGVWGTNLQDGHKCVLVVVAERLGFKPGELLLDWGSGCGFSLSWAKALYDVDGLGIDVTAAASWANHFSLGLSCVADGRKLEWIPNHLFDYVFSYAALLHLEFSEQCGIAHQLVQKLRIGGQAFLGWNRAHLVSPWRWYDCFRTASPGEAREVDLEILEEAHLFAEDPGLIPPDLAFLWHFPSYAVLLRRLS